MPRRLAVIGVAGSLLLAGCVGQPADRPHGRPAASSRPSVYRSRDLACDQFIGTAAPPRGLERVLGVVALPTAPEAPALAMARTGLPDPAGRLFTKVGLFVRVGSAFQLVAPRGNSGGLSFGWGNPGPRTRRVVVHGCTPYGRGSTGWLVYAGGFWVPHPECASLAVETHHRRALVRIGLGTACPGQRPPDGSTQG